VAEISGIGPNVAKSEGFRVKASEGDVVVLYFEPSAILQRRINSESEVLRLARLWRACPPLEGFPASGGLSRRGNHMAKSTPSLEFTNGGIQEFVMLL